MSPKHFKLVIVGGGAGGISLGSIFSRKIPKSQLAIIEPAKVHYYQPMWTLVGAGIKSFEESSRPMQKVMPKNVTWIQDSVSEFNPDNNSLMTLAGNKINYDFLVIAMGLQLDFHEVKGLKESILNPKSKVTTNYSPESVIKTFPLIERLRSGNACFTFPEGPIKCAGAAQKIMYLAESYSREHGNRSEINFHYMTPSAEIFMVPKYGKALESLCQTRDIKFNPFHKLVEIDDINQTVYFERLQSSTQNYPKIIPFKYNFLHVTPPMSASEPLKKSPLTDLSVEPKGYVLVDKEHLVSQKYPNVFALGDCNNAPKSKTAAAVAAELGVVRKNLELAILNKSLSYKSNGYSSCPIVIDKKHCILAEFDYDKKPMETFPVNQAVPRRTMFLMKKYGMPFLYWNIFLKGYWEGPQTLRKILHMGWV